MLLVGSKYSIFSYLRPDYWLIIHYIITIVFISPSFSLLGQFKGLLYLEESFSISILSIIYLFIYLFIWNILFIYEVPFVALEWMRSISSSKQQDRLLFAYLHEYVLTCRIARGCRKPRDMINNNIDK